MFIVTKVARFVNNVYKTNWETKIQQVFQTHTHLL